MTVWKMVIALNMPIQSLYKVYGASLFQCEYLLSFSSPSSFTATRVNEGVLALCQYVTTIYRDPLHPSTVNTLAPAPLSTTPTNHRFVNKVALAASSLLDLRRAGPGKIAKIRTPNQHGPRSRYDLPISVIPVSKLVS